MTDLWTDLMIFLLIGTLFHSYDKNVLLFARESLIMSNIFSAVVWFYFNICMYFVWLQTCFESCHKVEEQYRVLYIFFKQNHLEIYKVHSVQTSFNNVTVWYREPILSRETTMDKLLLV